MSNTTDLSKIKKTGGNTKFFICIIVMSYEKETIIPTTIRYDKTI
jgi:hypothetical protein